MLGLSLAALLLIGSTRRARRAEACLLRDGNLVSGPGGRLIAAVCIACTSLGVAALSVVVASRGVLLAIAAGLAGLVPGISLAMFLVGPLLPFAALARRGVRWARTTTVTFLALISVSGVAVAALMAPDFHPVHLIVTGLQLLLTVSAWHQLYAREARRYFHRAPSFSG